MEAVKVKINSTLTSARFGHLQPGAIVNTDAEGAKFLIEECRAGEYADAAPKANKPARAPQGEDK